MIYIEKLHQWATKENETKNSMTIHNKLIVTAIYSKHGVLQETENKAYLWVISALQAGHLIGCGKKQKIMRKFSVILCGRKRQFQKLIKLFPWVFQTYKIHINVLTRI